MADLAHWATADSVAHSSCITIVAVAIVATEAGTVNAYNSATSPNAIVVNNSIIGAVYKGLAITSNYLYVANFSNSTTTGSIVVFTNTFNVATLPPQGPPFIGMPAFTDPTIPSGFAPFNVAVINGLVYVLYAKKKASPDQGDDQAGPGNGFINIFTLSGNFVRRFVSGGVLNSPWAIIPGPISHGCNPGDFFVGNFGDGAINVFDSNGAFLRQLQNCDGSQLIIPGLWGLVSSILCQNFIYFASGPNDEHDGLVGFLTKC